MSVDAHRWVTAVLLDLSDGYGPNIGRTARAVLRELAEHHNAVTGRCSPSHARLARLVGLSDRQVRRALAELDAAGLIVWVEVPGRRCAYRFTTADLAAEVIHTPDMGDQGPRARPRTWVTATPDMGDQGPRSPMSYEPEEEPEGTARAAPGAATLTGGAVRYPSGELVPDHGDLLGPAAAMAAGLIPRRLRSP
jgi:hypothetical protein